MNTKRIALAGVLVAAGLSLGACATDGYYGGGYGGYYDYNGGYYDDGGLYYGPSYYGWYGDYYYPGSGIYVYDRGHHRHRWNDQQRQHWQNRGHDWHGNRPSGGNWDRFPHHPVPHGGAPNAGGGHWQGNSGGHWSGGSNGGNHSHHH